MKYTSEIIHEIIETEGHIAPSTFHYESECKEEWIKEIKGAYPKLTDYEGEWLSYYLENSGIGKFPYLAFTNMTQETVENCVPIRFKSAILKGSTKYRDIDTGDVLDTFDETKNLELVSVQMPVLMTVGANLLNNDDLIEGAYWSNSNGYYPHVNSLLSEQYIRVRTMETLYLGYNNVQVMEYDINKTFIQRVNKADYSYTVPNNVCYIRLSFYNCGLGKNIMISRGNKTTYEPFKSNSLTVNEDIELRGIGDVQDALDCLTGELTERIGEIVLNGSEDWAILEHNMSSVIGFYTSNPLPNVLPAIADDQRRIILSDTFVFKNQVLAKDEEFAFISTSGKLNLNIKRSKLDAITVAGFKSYLSKNPITIQYQLSNTAIKTVGLSVVNQEGQHSSLKAFEGTTNIQTNGQPIKPLLDIEVPVEAITQNLESFIEEE